MLEEGVAYSRGLVIEESVARVVGPEGGEKAV